MGLLFVAARELILDAGHQVVVVRAPDGPLDHVQPPRGVQLNLHREDNYRIYFSMKRASCFCSILELLQVEMQVQANIQIL